MIPVKWFALPIRDPSPGNCVSMSTIGGYYSTNRSGALTPWLVGSKIYDIICRSRFSSVGRASGSQVFWEHEFESRQLHLCNSMWGQDWLCASRQEVGKCSTRGVSQGTYITFASTMRIRQSTLALKPRGDVTRNPKQGYLWPQKRTCVRKNFKKKKDVWHPSHIDGWNLIIPGKIHGQ